MRRSSITLVLNSGKIGVSLIVAERVTHIMRPRTARLMKRLQQIEELPAAEQRAILKMVDALLEHRRATLPLARANRKASWELLQFSS